ncbi:MAG: hypothetical protein WBA12_13970 [Catalinimonas sp.]
MHAAKSVLLALAITLGLGACAKKVCPAYQSVFYLNGRERQAKFSVFADDSLPKEGFDVRKDKHLLLVSVTKRRKERQLNTVLMETIFPDQIETPGDSTRMIATDPDGAADAGSGF